MMKIYKEISHLSHHHKLKLEYSENPFDCEGCKEAGIGLKFKCEQCKFEMHKTCAVAPPTITHPFYKKCQFQLYQEPPGTVSRICDACGDDVLGLVYHCKRCGFDLHPCCANLPQVLDDGEQKLYLCVKLKSSCLRCGDKGPGWSYRSECKNYSLHVSCVKVMLVESWQAKYLNVDTNRVRDIQTKIPIAATLIRSTSKTRQNINGGRGGGTDTTNNNNKMINKYCQIAGSAITIIVSAILGDPTAIIAAVVGGLMPK